jgi:hypothetical protein
MVNHLHARVDAVIRETAESVPELKLEGKDPSQLWKGIMTHRSAKTEDTDTDTDMTMPDVDPSAASQISDTLGSRLDERLDSLSNAGLLPDDFTLKEVNRLMDWIKSVRVSLNPA